MFRRKFIALRVGWVGAREVVVVVVLTVVVGAVVVEGKRREGAG